MTLEARIRKLKKYKEFPTKGPLDEAKIQKLLKILFAVLDNMKCKPKYGSFILAGQNTYRNENIKTIVEFNFPCGKKLNCYGKDRDSERLAWNVVNDASGGSRLSRNESSITFFEDNPIYLNLNAMKGRFFAACYGDIDFHMQGVVYITIAKVLAKFFPKDTVLQESYQFTAEEQEYIKEMASLESFIDGLWEAF